MLVAVAEQKMRQAPVVNGGQELRVDAAGQTTVDSVEVLIRENNESVVAADHQVI